MFLKRRLNYGEMLDGNTTNSPEYIKNKYEGRDKRTNTKD